MTNEKSKKALYTAVTLLKGVIMQRALLVNPDESDEFIQGVDKATDALIADMYERVNEKWDAMRLLQKDPEPASNVISKEDLHTC